MSTRFVSAAHIEPPPHKPSDIGRLALFVGTAYLALGEHLRILRPDVAIAADVQGELEKLVIDPAYRDRVHFVPVGRGHTLHTLFAGATPEEQAIIADLPGSPARYGLSRIRIAGGVALAEINRGANYQRLIRQQVIPQLMQLVGGSCTDIQLDIFIGMSGGTGSRGGVVAARGLIEALLLDTDANIDVHVHALGAVTFNSPGFDRCRENAALALVDWLDFARRPMHPRVEVVLHLAELLPVGVDKGRRDQLAMDGVQAALAPELHREHYLQASNATFSGEYGNVRLARSGHFRALAVERIAADAAGEFLPEVARTLATRPDAGRVRSLDWFLESEPLPHESAEGLLERVLDADAEELIASALQPPARHEATSQLVLKDGRKLNLGDPAATFATPLVTVRQTRERICLLKTARREMAAEQTDLAGRRAELQAELDRATQRFHVAIREIQGATWRGLLRSEETKARRLHARAVAVHELVAELTEVEAKLAAAKRSLAELAELLHQLLANLKRLRKWLRRSLPQGDRRSQPAAIVPVAVDEVWKNLLGLSEDRELNLGKIQHMLAQTVRFVLPTGLAAIVGASDASFDAIVRSVANRRYMELSPAWGGHERDEPGSTWLVYPPVAPLTAKAISQHHAALAGPPQQIGFAQTAMGSVNVVQLEIRYCQRSDDAWPTFYQQGYQRAVTSERPGFYVCDPEAARRFGAVPPPNGDHKTK